ncbi:hypothetical protein L208DRAFT_1161297, partial [Tricholoma matsutake]
WWMEYISCFNFDIRYVKGKLNKVADTLSRYYQFDSWDDAPLVQHYVFADMHLNPNHEDLPWDQHLELKNRVIETCSTAAQQKRVSEQLKALRELIEERDVATARMTANTEELDPLNDNIHKGYVKDQIFKKILESPGDHPDFSIQNGFIWRENRGGDNILCIPTSTSKDTTLHGHIIEQAHSIVGHFGPVKTLEYIQHWYWW